MLTRRSFIHHAAVVATSSVIGKPVEPPSLTSEIGITTGSFMRHIKTGEFRVIDLPTIMRDELGMKVIDLMTATLESVEPAYLDSLRKAAADRGCILTNLKMNQPGLDMTSADESVRRRALDEYKRTIDAAARLGVRWVRPLPGNTKPDLAIVARSFRELIDHAAPLGIELLIENYGWIQDKPDAIPEIIAAVGPGLRAQPDTGNWTNAARDTGLARAFPLAVTCDFKAFEFDENGDHPKYDLKKCFDIGWRAGYRGPWCIEHFAPDLRRLLREMIVIRDQLRSWMAAG